MIFTIISLQLESIFCFVTVGSGMVGVIDGCPEGVSVVGRMLGNSVGMPEVGIFVGAIVVGTNVGLSVGDSEGKLVGAGVGA